MSKNLKELVEIVQFKLKLKQEDVARALGYSRGHFSTLLRDNDPVARKKMYLEYDKVLQDVSKEEPTQDAGKSKLKEDFYIETINDLRKTSVSLSETNREATTIGKETAIANRILAENQQSLIEILRIMHKSTADAARETQQDPAVQLQQCLEKIAKAGAPQYWESEKEGLKVLGKFLAGNQVTK